MARATGTSRTGSSVRETRTVSPMPSASRAPMPMALFTRPSTPLPASVTPRWKGWSKPSTAMRAASRR